MPKDWDWIAVVKRVKPFELIETLQDLYNAIMQPYFDYCCSLWDNCGKVLGEKLQNINLVLLKYNNGCDM